MAKNLVEFITALAKKSGLKMDDEKITAFLATDGLDKIEVPDEIGVIDNRLITIADAKNNHPDIKPHYFSQSLAPLDKIVETIVNEVGLDKESAAEILSNGSSYQRIQLLTKAIQHHEGKKNVSDKDAKAAYQKQIDDLHTQLRAEKTAVENAKTGYESELRNFKLNQEKKGLFSEHKTIYDELPMEVRNATFLNLLDKELQDKGAVIDYDDSGALVLRKKDGTNYYGENNVQLTHKQFTEQVLSKNKLLKVTAPPVNGNNNNPNNGQNRNNPNGGNANNGNNSGSQFIKTFNEQAIKDAQNSAASIG